MHPREIRVIPESELGLGLGLGLKLRFMVFVKHNVDDDAYFCGRLSSLCAKLGRLLIMCNFTCREHVRI